MRLHRLNNGHRWPNRLFLAMVRRAAGEEPSDVIKLLNYRPQFFGSRFSSLIQNAMRGPSPWSVGERELFAAWTSQLNQCEF
jgi:hypothetical protein